MYYVDMDLVDYARDLIESTVRLCSNYFEEDDKNVKFLFLILISILATKRMAYFIPFIT
jgi:hypothetical protein